VDTAGAAAYLGTTPRHIRDLKSRGRLPFVQLGRLIRFDLDELDRLRRDLLVPGVDEADRVAAAVSRVVDHAPQLTPEQVAMLRAAGLTERGAA
jgi:excisionase family DNA binding protein